MNSVLFNMSKHKLDTTLVEYFDECVDISISDLSTLKIDPKKHNIFYAPDVYSQSKVVESVKDKEECYFASPNVSYVSDRYFRFESWHITLIKN